VNSAPERSRSIELNISLSKRPGDAVYVPGEIMKVKLGEDIHGPAPWSRSVILVLSWLYRAFDSGELLLYGLRHSHSEKCGSYQSVPIASTKSTLTIRTM
jgi:hypothetical protein